MEGEMLSTDQRPGISYLELDFVVSFQNPPKLLLTFYLRSVLTVTFVFISNSGPQS